MQNPLLTVVVCVYNEEDNIKPLVDKIKSALSEIDYELLYVDDGSTDRTLVVLKEQLYDRLRIVEFRRNYGQSSAMYAGIQEAKGQFIATMDGDLQNDPTDIPMMLQKAIDEDWDMVAGMRANRKDGLFLRKIPSQIANYMIRRSSGVTLKDYGCTLKVFRSEIAKDLGLYGELHRFIPVLATLEGAKITQVAVKHHSRIHGTSKYGMGRTVKVISDLLLMLFFKQYLQRPMHLFGNIGIICLLGGGAINFYMLILKIMGQEIWGKPLLLLGIMLLLSGIQLLTFGLLFELQMRTYYESQSKRPYRIRKIHTTHQN